MLTGNILCLVAGVAAHSVNSVAILAPLHVLQMLVAVISLKRSVASGMAILAARRSQHAIHLEKRSARSIRILPGCASRQPDCDQGRRGDNTKNAKRVWGSEIQVPRTFLSSRRESVHDFAPFFSTLDRSRESAAAARAYP